MQDGKVPENDPKLLEEMRQIVQSRLKTYGGVKGTFGLTKEQKVWKNVHSSFQLLAKDDGSDYERSLDYGDFLIRQTRMTTDQFGGFLENLIHGGILSVPDGLAVPIEGFLQKESFYSWSRLASNDVKFGVGWSANIFSFQVSPNFRGGPPGEPLISLTLPLFDSGYSALRSLLGQDEGVRQYMGVITFLLPDYRARIVQVRLSSKRLSLKVQAKETPLEDVLAKVYCEGNSKIRQADLPFAGDVVEMPLDFSPSLYTIYLLSKQSGEVLDYRRFDVHWPNLPEDIVMEPGPEEIEQVIQRGENDQVEFKQELPKNREDFAKAIVAFLNTHGGTIFLGVDNDGNVVGVKDPSLEETVNSIVRSHIEPPADVQVTKAEARNQPIVLVKVKEGGNKPYTVKDKGPYVRAGSTNRIASRFELDDMYARRGQLGPVGTTLF